MSRRSATDADLAPHNVPSPGDPDRKRVLNVLAQRRYRQRKRERLAELEARAAGSASRPPQARGSTASAATISTPSDGSGEYTPRAQDPAPAAIQGANGVDDFVTNATFDPTFSWASLGDQSNGYDPVMFLDSSTTSSSSHENFLSFSFTPSDNSPLRDIDFFLHQPPSEDSPDADNQSHHPQNVGRFSPSESSMSPEHDDVEIPMLKTLRAGMAIAKLLDCESTLFDPFYKRTLDPSKIPNLSMVPANLIPTEAQKRIPHHPMVDVLPWATVRTRLTYIFSLPPQMRPYSARDPLAIMQIAYDLEDLREGCRIVGGNGLKEEDWEIGEAFLRNWWWALDRAIIENTNRLRARRGAPRLKIDAAHAVA